MSDRKASDRKAEFEELLSQHQQRIYGYIFALLRNSSDAQDVLQQTAIVLWNKFDQFDLDTNFFNWAATVARFEVLNFTKYRRRSRLYFDHSLMEQLAEDVSERSADYCSSRSDALKDCMKKLAPNDQKLVETRYSHGLGSRQIAEILGRSPASVCNSLLRVRKALLNCIELSVQREGL